MSSPKMENLLSLALETDLEQREKSLNLNVGYEETKASWELIVKYNGNLERLREFDIEVEELINGYAILTVPEEKVDLVANFEEIEYIEKPKRLYFNLQDAKRESCIPQVTIRPPFLSGEGCVVAVLDSGIDYWNMNFRKEDGSSRILFLWDQSLKPDEAKGFYSPAGFSTGVEFTKEQIDAALFSENPEEGKKLVPSKDVSGHGTAVAGIAAGNDRGKGAYYEGVAPKSDLIVVKLGGTLKKSFPRTTELMRGLWYVVKKASDLRLPIAVNISFGNSYGAHDGNSLLERFMDNISEIGRTVICVGSGNEGAAAGHAMGNLKQEDTRKMIELAVSEYESYLNIQLWKNYVDRFRVILHSPSGEKYEVPVNTPGKGEVLLDETKVLLFVGAPRPYSVSQEIYFDMIPVGEYVNPGIWKLELIPEKIVTGQFNLYLPSSSVLNRGTLFFLATPEVTLTIPSTARKVITVGAYNSTFDAYADFSGRGFNPSYREKEKRVCTMIKPDLVAPGVGILAPDLAGGYQEVTGTSFATPIVTGAAALLMEWGIVKRNDPYLYGEKVKAYLQSGARRLPGYENFPNAQIGYGVLCVKNSFPK